MPVSQAETALSRGRIPSYLRRQFHILISLLLDRRARRSRLFSRLSLSSPQMLRIVVQYNRQRSTSRLLSSLFMSLFHHYYSYDMYVRPTVLFNVLPLDEPINELPSSEFYELSGFWPGQLKEILENLTLIPERIVCPITRCAASKEVSIFLLLCH